jgi:very-short-patch-repair endonuclease
MGPCILDFVCLEKHLIMEVDGPQHAEEAHAAPTPAATAGSRARATA